MTKINKKVIVLFAIPFLLTACVDKMNIKGENLEINSSKSTSLSTSSPKQFVESKKYNNERYEFSFNYPEDLKIVKDEGTNKETSLQNFWYLKMEGLRQGNVVGLNLDLTTKVAANNLSELKEHKKLGFGGDLVMVGEEERVSGEKKFFIAEWKDSNEAVFIVASTLISPGIDISIGVFGFKDAATAKDMLYSVVDSFK